MSTYVINYLSTVAPMSRELEERLRRIVRVKKVAKKNYLLQKGEISNYVYVVEKGFLRCYYKNGKKETTVWFMGENDVINSVISFYSRTPSHENIEVLEDCILHYIHYDQLQQLYLDFPEFNLIGRLLTIKYYMLSEERLFNIRNLKAEDRYTFLKQRHPEIYARARVGDIASYLGITISTLSRIRSKEATLSRKQ
jgi:CRP/FNR family transcriptional regulator, anaerobic regulatory protein